jgi:hypothetical protein
MAWRETGKTRYVAPISVSNAAWTVVVPGAQRPMPGLTTTVQELCFLHLISVPRELTKLKRR